MVDSLALVELCSRHRVAFEIEEQGVRAFVRGHYRKVRREILVTKAVDDLVGAFMVFPPCERAIEDPERLVEVFLGLFTEHISAAYDPEERRYYLYGFISAGDFPKLLRKLANVYDMAAPLFEAAGRRGTWDTQLLEFALTPGKKFALA